MSDKTDNLIWKGYALYCYAAAFLNFATAVGGFWLIGASDRLATEFFPAWWLKTAGYCTVAIGVFFGIAMFWLLARPWTKKWWTTHFVNLILGAGSVILTPLCLWLIFKWFDPEFRAQFPDSSPPPRL